MEMINHEIDFKNYLKARGLRFTPERRLILESIAVFPGHFDIDKLYQRLHRKTRKLSLATIYRTFVHLTKSGLIKEVMRYDNRPLYEKGFGYPHHDHLVCIECGQITEFKDEVIEKLQDKVCQRYRFKPTEHRLGIRGYCKNCRLKAKKK